MAEPGESSEWPMAAGEMGDLTLWEQEILSSVPSTLKLRILALHPKCSWAERFVDSLSKLQLPMQHFEFVEADAPFLLQEDGRGGRQWWKLPPNERSFTTEAYEGDEEAVAICEMHLGTGEEDEDKPDRIDGLLGFSQGAMLVAILVAKIICQSSPARLPQFSMLFGAAIPRPYEDELWKMREILAAEEDWDAIDKTTGLVASPPSTSRLQGKDGNDEEKEGGKRSDTFVVEPSLLGPDAGEWVESNTICSFHALSERDRTNPSEMGDWVAQCFGKYAEIYWHQEGHRMPMEKEGLLRVRSFLFRQLKYKHDGRLKRKKKIAVTGTL